MKIKSWSILGRLHTLILKLISFKGLAFLIVLGVWAANPLTNAYAVLGFIAALLGIREYGKVKLNGKTNAS